MEKRVALSSYYGIKEALAQSVRFKENSDNYCYDNKEALRKGRASF